jgi:rhamnogalacturonan endolyase
MDPSRAGLQVWQAHEDQVDGATYRDAGTGAIIWQQKYNADTGRACASNVSTTVKGYNMWSGVNANLWSTANANIGAAPASTNFVCWWDADTTREILNDIAITKYGGGTLLTATGSSSNNGSKSVPCLSADILGDWREEVIWRSTDNTQLRIYTTTAVTTTRIFTLMHDRQYREAIAWQNTGYNQPPHPSFYLGYGMTLPVALPSITLVGGTSGTTYQAENATLAGGTWVENTNGGYIGAAYVNFPATGGTCTFSNVSGNGGGSKSLAIRYSNGSGATRTGNLVVNGTTTAITFPTTTNWTTWATMNVTITLNNNSTNTIQFASTGNDLGNLDQITVP